MTNRFKIILSILFVLFLLLGARYARAETTSNLTTTLNNWNYSGGVTSLNNNTIIFNWQGGTVTSPNINLNSALTQSEINKGFTTNYGVDILYWCNNNIGGYCENNAGHARDTVIMTQRLTGSDGSIVTQNRTITEGYNPNFVNYQDRLIINSNSLTNYTVNLSIYGIDNGYWAGWWGPQVSNPTLTIDYTKDVVLSTSTTTQLQSTETNLLSSQQTLQTSTNTLSSTNTLENTLSTNTFTISTTNTLENTLTAPTSTTVTNEQQNTNLQQSMTTSDTSTSTKETSNVKSTTSQESQTSSTTTSTQTTTTSETTKTSSSEPTSSTNTKTEGSQTQTNTKENVADTKTATSEKGVNNVSVNVKAQLEKVEKELKNIGDKTKAIQEIKIEGIKAGSPNLAIYENKQFYDVRQMVGVPNPDFYKQINIEQQQIYKDASLSAYISKDPIAVKQHLLKEIEDEQSDIIIQIELLKKGLNKG